VKTTYVPNTIEIPIHEADLKHHGVEFEGRSKNRGRKVEREHRQKESEEEEREREGTRYLGN
jgi:hypothetical protein